MSDVEDKDRGWKAIGADLNDLSGRTLVVGVLGNAPRHPSGLNLADIATFNEFGTDTIPARSFLRSTVDENKNYDAEIRALVRNLGARGALQALELLGMKITADVKRKIVELDEPPNAPATVEKKGSSNPLIDTGRLRQGIDYEVK